MNIIAITIGSYPYGEAATNRHLSYLRGLAEKKNSVELLALAPAKIQSIKSNLKDTEYSGITIKYLSPSLYPKSKISRVLNYLYGSFHGLLYLTFRKKLQQKRKILILLITSPILLFFYLGVGRLLGYKIVHERTEYPFLGHKNSFLLKIYLNYIVPKFDGIIVITYSLKEYFQKCTTKNIFVLPMSVEAERFSGKKKIGTDRYIAYCGSMYSDKDGVPDLIKAFSIVAEKYRDIQLILIGDNRDANKFKIISDSINQSPFKDRIICTGLIDRDNMPQFLINAELLALARPDNIQAKGGFPTKLGEYLSTGNPVVITDVGEHSIYLQDKVSACLVQPGNPTAFAEKIAFLLDNPDKAKEIGLMGKKVAIQFFDFQSQSANLINYFNEL